MADTDDPALAALRAEAERIEEDTEPGAPRVAANVAAAERFAKARSDEHEAWLEENGKREVAIRQWHDNAQARLRAEKDCAAAAHAEWVAMRDRLAAAERLLAATSGFCFRFDEDRIYSTRKGWYVARWTAEHGERSLDATTMQWMEDPPAPLKDREAFNRWMARSMFPDVFAALAALDALRAGAKGGT